MGLIDKLAGSIEERTIEGVARNIEHLLNARPGYGAVVEIYGVGGFDAYVRSKPLVESLKIEMAEAIRRFEPRLKGPTIEVVGRDRQLWVRILISGLIDDRPQRFEVLFHSVFREARVEPIP